MFTSTRVDRTIASELPKLARAPAVRPEPPLMGTTALRIPLVIKLLGANALALAIVSGYMFRSNTHSIWGVVLVVAAAMVVFALLAAIA